MGAKLKVTVGRVTNFRGFLYTLLCVATAMVGYNINHGSLGWAIMDFLFAPLAWCKWLICHQVNLSMVKYTFNFLLQ